MSHFCFCLWFLLAANWRRSNWTCRKKTKNKSHNGGAHQHGKISERHSLLTSRIHKLAAVGVAKQTNKLRCCYNGHLEQPHSRAVSISSEYEVLSVQRKTTFLFRLLVTPQQTPGGAAVWQDRVQFMCGILLVDVHVLMGWWRFSCSLTISPWHVTSGHWWKKKKFNFDLLRLLKSWDIFLLIYINSFYISFIIPVLHVGPVYPGWQWQTGSPASDTRHSPCPPQRCPLQAGGSCRRSQNWPW